MTNFKSLNLILILILSLLANSSALAESIATSNDGRQVILNQNGTWKYLSKVAPVKTSAIKTMSAYLQAKSWRDRIPLVLNEERVGPLMETYYRDSRVWTPPKASVSTTTEPIIGNNGWYKIDVNFSGQIVSYYLKEKDNGYKIDWESSVGVNQYTVEELKATKPTSPVRMRFFAELSDYFNYEFRIANNIMWSVRFSDYNGRSLGYGYVSKTTDDGARLFAALKDGRKHQVVVDVAYLPNAQSSDVFLVSNLVTLDTWWVDE
jgi:hypothetical protein